MTEQDEKRTGEVSTFSQDRDSSLMNLIAQMATDKESDVVKLEKLIDLQNAVLNREARKAFAQDFIRMKPKLPRVISLHKNLQTNSMYAKLEDINKIIDPILAEHGFATSHKIMEQTERSVTVRVELWHKEGHVESTELKMPIDDSGILGKINKTQLHATASTIMYLRRVGECALLNISTGQDTDGNLPNWKSELITEEQARQLDARLRAISDKALPSFLSWAGRSLGVETLQDIRSCDYKRVDGAVSNMEKESKNKGPVEGK